MHLVILQMSVYPLLYQDHEITKQTLQYYGRIILQQLCLNSVSTNLNPLSTNPTKKLNTLKQIVWVRLTILQGWRLKG